MEKSLKLPPPSVASLKLAENKALTEAPTILAASSLIEASELSPVAIGASLTGSTEIVTVADSSAPPLVMTYEKVSVPLKSESGV